MRQKRLPAHASDDERRRRGIALNSAYEIRQHSYRHRNIPIRLWVNPGLAGGNTLKIFGPEISENPRTHTVL
jgi:hypothetical protein